MKWLKALWHKHGPSKKKPWVDLVAVPAPEGVQLSVKDYNQAFVRKLRAEMGDLTENKTDEQVIEIYVSRDRIDREDPKLEVLHMGLDQDGRVKMKLDWNKAFIRHLAENGIQAPTDEEAVQVYLARLTLQAAENEAMGVTKDELEQAYEDLERNAAESEAEAEAITAELPRRKVARRRQTRNRTVN